MRQNARCPMPMLLSMANSRRRRMIEFVSVLNTFATAIAPVMRMKQFMNSCTVSPMSRLARASSALFVRYVRYHSLPVNLVGDDLVHADFDGARVFGSKG